MLVVAASPRLRDTLVDWLRADRGVRIVAALAGSEQITAAHRFCDLVVASGLGSREELEAIRDRLGRSDGLVAFTLREEPLPHGWVRAAPGSERASVLARAGHGPRKSSRLRRPLEAGLVAAAALTVGNIAAFTYAPSSAVSWQRAALEFAIRFPSWDDVWWHTWGAGAPLLADPSWPALRLAAALGDAPSAFRLLALAGALLCAAAVALLATHLRSGRYLAVGAGLATLALPAVWSWARGGDATSLLGLAGTLLAASAAFAASRRIAAVALSIGLAATGGYVWLVAAALCALLVSRSSRLASLSGVALGVLLSSAITVPPLLARGDLALLPPLARSPAVSDAAPVVVCVLSVCGAWALRSRRVRGRLLGGLAGALVLGGLALSSSLALAVSVAHPDPPLASHGPFTRVAASPENSLGLVVANPTLSVTAAALDRPTLRGENPLEAQRARLDWFAVDRALAPDETAALRYYDRDWRVLDRGRLLFRGPDPRPVLTVGNTTSILVVAKAEDAVFVGDAFERLGATSDFLVPVRALQPLEALSSEVLRRFTAVFVYGNAFENRAAATRVLDEYVGGGGIVIVEAAGTTGAGLLGITPQTLDAPPDTFVVRGDPNDFGPGRRFADGRTIVATARPEWESASVSDGERRVLAVGAKDGGKVAWSGADLPRRAAAGDEVSLAHLGAILRWALAATAETSGPWLAPEGDDYLFDDGHATFLAPGRWRIDLLHAVTGVLFKEATHAFWTAYQVEVELVPRSTSPTVAEVRSRIPLPILPTTQGFMYVALPPNARRIEFVFETPYRDVARGLSAVALLGIGASVMRRRLLA